MRPPDVIPVIISLLLGTVVWVAIGGFAVVLTPHSCPVGPEHFSGATVHTVTCNYSPYTPSIIQCVGDVPIHLEGRKIRLISEPWDGGTQ